MGGCRKKGLHGLIAGSWIFARFDFSLNQCMMCCRAQRTCTYGGREKPPIVNYVLGKDLYNISLVVAQKQRWCNDQALKVIANEVTKAMRASNHQPGKKLKQINFVKAEKIQRKRREKNEPVIFRGRLAVDSGSGDSAEVPQTHSCNIAKTGPDIAL